MLPHWGIPLLFLCNACRKVWFSSLCLGPFFRRQQFLFLKRAPVGPIGPFRRLCALHFMDAARRDRSNSRAVSSAFGLRAFQKGTFPFMVSTLELKPPCS